MAEKIALYIIGASSANGVGDSEGGFAVRLGKKLSSSIELNVFNLAIPGDTTTGMLERFEREIRPRVNLKRRRIILFYPGGNDASTVDDVIRTDEVTYKANVKQILQAAKRITEKILCIEHRKVDETKTAPIPWTPNKKFLNSNYAKHVAILREVCNEENVSLIKQFDDPVQPDILFHDGLHMNEKGHEALAQKVLDMLVERGWTNTL